MLFPLEFIQLIYFWGKVKSHFLEIFLSNALLLLFPSGYTIGSLLWMENPLFYMFQIRPSTEKPSFIICKCQKSWRMNALVIPLVFLMISRSIFSCKNLGGGSGAWFIGNCKKKRKKERLLKVSSIYFPRRIKRSLLKYHFVARSHIKKAGFFVCAVVVVYTHGKAFSSTWI